MLTLSSSGFAQSRPSRMKPKNSKMLVGDAGGSKRASGSLTRMTFSEPEFGLKWSGLPLSGVVTFRPDRNNLDVI
jgi:hypothetical protein